MPHQFWISETVQIVPILQGFGVNAIDRNEAVKLVIGKYFQSSKELANSKSFYIIENVQISDLDPNHVLPNIGAPERYGLWYPPCNLTSKELRAGRQELAKWTVRIRLWMRSLLTGKSVAVLAVEYLVDLRSG